MLSPKTSAPELARLPPPQQFCRSCGSKELERGEAVGTIQWFNCRVCAPMWTQPTKRALLRLKALSQTTFLILFKSEQPETAELIRIRASHTNPWVPVPLERVPFLSNHQRRGSS